MMLFVIPHMLIGLYLIRSDRREQGWGGDWEPE